MGSRRPAFLHFERVPVSLESPAPGCGTLVLYWRTRPPETKGYHATANGAPRLGCIHGHKNPDAAVVDFLRKYALASEAKLPPDDLAREIVQREVAKRKRANK